MKVFEIDELAEKEWKASKKLCKSSTPNNKLGASALSSCKAQGYRSRETGKSQKIGNKRVKLGGKRIRSQDYGGPVSSTRTG
jgi:hypothetical protein